MTSPEEIDSNRRGFFAVAALPLLVFGLGSRTRAAPAPAAPSPCYNPANLTAGQANMRKNVDYRKSTDPAKKCGGCMYFSASATTAGCGRCQILLNGPVSAEDVCNTWTKKAS